MHEMQIKIKLIKCKMENLSYLHIQKNRNLSYFRLYRNMIVNRIIGQNKK